MAELLTQLQCKIIRVLIVDYSNKVFHALIHARSSTARTISVEARPSPAINLALRHNAPIYVHATVIAQGDKYM
jgi:bifunctional DNase/RNase